LYIVFDGGFCAEFHDTIVFIEDLVAFEMVFGVSVGYHDVFTEKGAIYLINKLFNISINLI